MKSGRECDLAISASNEAMLIESKEAICRLYEAQNIPPLPDFCPGQQCGVEEIEDYSGGCVPEDWVDDGICNENLNCSLFGFDNGDFPL